MSAYEPFVCGGIAACFASCVIHPIDLAKVRLQLWGTTSKPPSFPVMLMQMQRTEGIRSWYSGLSAALMRQAVYGTARIGLHRKLSDYLIERNDGKPIGFFVKMLSGMASGAVAVCIGTPFDVALVRMQSDSMLPMKERRGYKNVFDALIRMTKEEGIGRLYSGLAPNILRGMSMNAGMLACYDQAKQMIVEHITNDVKSMKTQVGASLVAGFCAAAFSLPFDMIKSRLQSGNYGYTGILHAGTSILTKEGPSAFWTGFGAYYGRCAPHSMIILLSSEKITDVYRKILQIPPKKA